MTPRFLGDEDLNADIVLGVLRREPAVDFLDVKTAGLRRRDDADLLEIAAQQGRILVSHDRATMTLHFHDRFARGLHNPGLLLLPQRVGIGEAIESLLLIWAASDAEEWADQIVYLPFR